MKIGIIVVVGVCGIRNDWLSSAYVCLLRNRLHHATVESVQCITEEILKGHSKK